MNRRQRNTQVRVAFVRANHKATSLGYRKVHSRNTRLSTQETLSQMMSSFVCKIGWIRRTLGRTNVLVHCLAHFFLLDMNRRQHNVARSLVT